MIDTHEKYMHRCLELAKKGAGTVSPNPMVGSVIVHNGVIIGEGYHRKCGEAHAEVNAVNSVKDKTLLKESSIYVSLEPCAHVGRTPSCADMIIREEIPEIIIGSTDPYFQVAGKGIQKLESAGRTVITGVLESECIDLNKRFYTYHQKKRPYIILKWAQTKDGYVDFERKPGSEKKAFWITNNYCKTLVHKWRTEEDAFMIGTNTVILDNPQLTARNWVGKNPMRVTIDEFCELDNSFQLFDNQADTIVFNSQKNNKKDKLNYIQIDFKIDIIPQILKYLYDLQVLSLVVEGGSKTLESFISAGLWDEARVFTGDYNFGKGVCAPQFVAEAKTTEVLGNSELRWYYNNEKLQKT